MSKILFALLAIALASGQAAASDKTDVMAAVNRFADAFNKGDVKELAATCAEETSIIDEFPPHEWHGVGSCTRWAADYDADAKKNGITDGLVTLSQPRHIDVTADHAYVVGAASYVFKKNGSAVKETNSTFTLSMQKTGGSWRITGWAWSKE